MLLMELMQHYDDSMPEAQRWVKGLKNPDKKFLIRWARENLLKHPGLCEGILGGLYEGSDLVGTETGSDGSTSRRLLEVSDGGPDAVESGLDGALRADFVDPLDSESFMQ